MSYRRIKSRYISRSFDQRTYSRPATAEETAAARRALFELESSFLSVVLVPAPKPSFDGHKVRVAENRNPDWYRDLSARHGHQFKRQRVVKALFRLASGRVRGNGLERELLEVIG